MADKVYNFSAGPAMIPEEVMAQAHKEFTNWNNTGMSMMEISHRSEEFFAIADEARDTLREILNIPANYHILFLHGGGRSQFAMVPMNLLGKNSKCAYVKTGIWGKIALTEAMLFGEVNVVADAEPLKFTTIPDQKEWEDFSDAAYLHYVDNETINGIEFPYIPDSKGLPLVCDMSSNILSRPFNVEKFDLIYACAQKNMGISGITVVIIRDDLLHCEPVNPIPSMFNYRIHVEKNSMQNTAPTYPWYMAGLIYQWVKRQGGVAELAKRNERKAKKLYEFLDQSNFYNNPIEPTYRSKMNVIFRLPNEELEALFVAESVKANFSGLKGHRYSGGIRASIYNAMPEAGVDALLEFMEDFERRHAKSNRKNKHEQQIST